MRSLYSLTSLFLIGTLLLAASCTSNQESQPENTATEVDLSLQEELRIASGDGTDESAPLLGGIANVATGPEGDIYLYDSDNGRIFVYGPDGSYLRAFGRSGEGPGEFGSISDMVVDRQNRVIVSDFGNARFSLFDEEGDLIKREPLHGLRSARDMTELPDGRFAVTGWHADSERTVHILSPDLSRIETSLVALDSLVQSEDNRIVNTYQSFPGQLQVLEDGRLAFVPTFYDGELRIYEEGDDGTWSLSERLEGYRRVEEALLVTEQNYNSPSEAMEELSPNSILSIAIRQGGSTTLVHARTRSQGLFRDGGGGLLHVLRYFEGTEHQVVVERFDPGSGLTSYGTILEGREGSINVNGMTQNGQLYLSNPDSLTLQRVQILGFD
ncbi:MAG: 6-bladed beta-propeller [Balneolaceae bacterium]|nr:6-bladed beta-propeller [Balneolaceae bacterium]